MKSFFVTILFQYLYFQFACEIEISDYRNHPCNRNCDLDSKPKICEYNFTLEWYTTLSKACFDCPNVITDCYRPECVASNGVIRSINVINRMLPGPAIQVCKDDVVSVKLFNNMHHAEATTIHWHGLRQKKTPYMDGTSMITQCPILPHTTFEYYFTAEDAGTHLWHAHSGLQRQDGVFGAFIVRTSSKENFYSKKYDFDLSEHTIIVTDWVNETAVEKFVQHHHNNGNNKPNAILINGKGVYYEYQNNSNINNIVETPRANFTVKKGFSYRFRLINAGSLYCPIQISIDNHNLTVISTDGNDVEPIEVQVLTVYAGERFDFILNANQDSKSYWIRAKGFADCSVNKVYQTAFLNYESDSYKPITLTRSFNYTTMDRPGILLNPWNLKVTQNNSDSFIQIDQLKAVEKTEFAYDGQVDKKFYLSMEFNKINNVEFQNPSYYPLTASSKKIFTPQINNISMMMPSSPLLYQWNDIPKGLICNQTNKNTVCPPNQSDYCSCIHVLEINLNELVELVIVDEGFTYQSNHPMHLHGYEFAVIGIEKLNSSINTKTVIEMDQNGLLKRNLLKAPLKDTVTVPVGGYTIIRFRANNPGAWLFHCHLEFHSEAGMALAFKVGNQNDLPKEPTNWPKCGSYYSSRDHEFFENTNLNAAFRGFIGNYFLTILTFLSIFTSI